MHLIAVLRSPLSAQLTSRRWETYTPRNGLVNGSHRALLVFHGRFYGPENFCCKTLQFCATPRESETTETPSVSNGAQHRENKRKNSFLN
jgi:hypothetical protein